MAVMLDLLGSTMISGLLILTMLRVNAAGMENQSYFSEDLMVQENLREIVRIIESDFRKIGYRIDPDNNGSINIDSIFVLCDSTELQFRSDIYNEHIKGFARTITYRLGDLIGDTPNDSDRYLWRQVSGYPAQNIAAGLIRFRLRYLAAIDCRDLHKITSNNIDSIGSVELTLALQSPFVIRRQDLTLRQSFRETTTLWRQTQLVARNLNR